MNDFSKRYKSLTITELLTVLEQPEKYKSIAVETAKKELKRRKLTDNELEQAKFEVKLQKKKDIELKDKWDNKEKTINEYLKPAFDHINPIQQNHHTADRIINLIILILGFMLLYQVYDNYLMFRYIFIDKEQWDLVTLEYLFLLLFIPITVLLFWKRKKIGWILLLIFSILSAFGSVVGFFSNLGMNTTIFQITSPFVYFFSFLFYMAIIFSLSRKDIRKIFSVSKKGLHKILGSMLLVIVLFVIRVLLL